MERFSVSKTTLGILDVGNFLNFVKDELSFFYFSKLNVLLLPDINLFKNNFAQTPRVLWSGNSFCLVYFRVSKVLNLNLQTSNY